MRLLLLAFSVLKYPYEYKIRYINRSESESEVKGKVK
jgi:hypothetical protein